MQNISIVRIQRKIGTVFFTAKMVEVTQASAEVELSTVVDDGITFFKHNLDIGILGPHSISGFSIFYFFAYPKDYEGNDAH